MWAEFAFGTILAICGFLVKRTLNDIDENQKKLGRTQVNLWKRIVAIEKNQALERQALSGIDLKVLAVSTKVDNVNKAVRDHQTKTDIRIGDMESMSRKNQESLGKIIIIMKKLVLKK